MPAGRDKVAYRNQRLDDRAGVGQFVPFEELKKQAIAREKRSNMALANTALSTYFSVWDEPVERHAKLFLVFIKAVGSQLQDFASKLPGASTNTL